MQRIIGRFYLMIDSNGDLSGQFSNNLHNLIYPERAIRSLGTGFLGEYQSTWTDELGTAQSRLIIRLKPNSNDIYSLRWTNDTTEFYGEGFVVNNILIGDYRNFENI